MSQNIETIKHAHEAFARGDIERFLAPLAPEFEWIEPAGSPFAGVYRNRAELIERYLLPLGTEFEAAIVSDDFIEVAETVIVRGRYEATHRRTGRKLTVRYAMFHEFEEGRLVRFEHFVDTALYERALA